MDLAIADYDHALLLYPEYPGAHLNRGDAFVSKQKYALAIADFTEALRQQPKFSAAHLARGDVYLRIGDDDKALEDFTEALREDPKDTEALFHLGIAHERTGQNMLALGDYNKAISLDPKSINGYFGRGRLLFDESDFVNAAVDLSAASKLEPANEYLLLWLHVADQRASKSDDSLFSVNSSSLDLTRWPGPIVALFLRKATRTQVVSAAAGTQSCQAYFFIAEWEIENRKASRARSDLQRAIDLCPADFVESLAARAEQLRSRN
jgi:tetratricopeptide (TPR) repeat protein